MSFILGVIGAFVIMDGFDGHWSQKKEWEVIAGFVFVFAACVVYWVSNGED